MVQVRSIADPLGRPGIAGPTLAVLKRAGAMGLLSQDIPRLDLPALRDVVQSLRKAGIGRDADEAMQAFTAGGPPQAFDRGGFLSFIQVLTDALEESPAPAYEWQRMAALFQPDLEDLAGLLGISLSSLRRYSAKERATPDDVAARLHFLALLTSDLASAYNEMGIRNWFQRKRALLDGKAPKALLQGGWRPGDPGPDRVRALARSLAAGSFT